MEDKLVIFDCDGVLVDSEALSLRSLVSCLEACGISKQIEHFDAASYKGAKLASILEKIEEESGGRLPSDFETNYRKRMDELFLTDLKSIEGIAAALKRIPYPTCVASSGPVNKIKRSLELTGLAASFGNRVFSSYTIQSWKPEPDLFLHAAEKMKVSPKSCVVVEDSILGVRAAIRAGMKVAAFLSDQSEERAFLELGGVPFYRMDQLPALIEALLS